MPTATIQLRRGAEASIPTLAAGEPGFTTDTHKLFVGDGATNHIIGPGVATLNGVTGDVTIAVADGLRLTVSGNTITVSTVGLTGTLGG